MKRATGGGRALKKRKEMSDISSTRPSFRAYGWGEGGGLEEGSCGYARCPQVTSELLQVVWLLCFDREPDPRSIMLWHVERGHTPPGELLSRISSSEGLKFYAGVLSPEIVCNWRGFAGDGSAVHCRRGSLLREASPLRLTARALAMTPVEAHPFPKVLTLILPTRQLAAAGR